MDASLFEIINHWAGKITWLDSFMVLSAKYFPVLFAIVLVILYLTFQARQQRVAVLASISTLIAMGIAQGIAFLFPRPRPYLTHAAHLLITPSHDPSFPSDHATFCFAIAVMIVLYNRRRGLVLVCLAALVGFSRIFVGTHYPMDVIGGVILGTTISLLTNYVAKLKNPRVFLDRFFMMLHSWHLAAKPESTGNL